MTILVLGMTDKDIFSAKCTFLVRFLIILKTIKDKV